MLQQDYLMNMIWQFVEGMRRSIAKGGTDPAKAAASLENAVAQSMDMDAELLLGLQPESFASILQVSGTDERVVEYIVRSLVLEAHYLEQADAQQMADLRHGQALALAQAYGIQAPEKGVIPDDEDLEAILEEEGIEFSDEW
jgi:hypothetical protein